MHQEPDTADGACAAGEDFSQRVPSLELPRVAGLFRPASCPWHMTLSGTRDAGVGG